MGLYQWVGPGTNIGDGDNWRDEIHGTTGTEPASSDDVTMFTTGTFTGGLQVDSIALESQGSGTLKFDQGASIVCQGTTATTVTGLVTFQYAHFEPDGLDVGAGSTLSVTGQSSVSDFHDPGASDINIGSQMGTAAVVVDHSSFYVQRSGGTLTLGAGSEGNGMLTVKNGAQFSTEATMTLLGGGESGSTGQVLVTGATTTADFDGMVEIGGDSTGSFTVADDGYASLGGHSDVDVGALNANGTITATGAGSLLSVANDLSLGGRGSGYGLGVVSQGATLAAGGDIATYVGSLAVSGAGSVLSGRDYLSQVGGVGLSIAGGATASFITAFAASGSILLQGGTLAVRGDLEIYAKINGYGVVNAGDINISYGTLAASGGTLQVIGPQDGTSPGNDIITRASTLELDGSAAMRTRISFQAGASTLALKDPADMAGLIRGFGAGETIDLLNDAATKLSFANDILTISNGTTVDATLHFTGSYTAANFKLSSDGHGGSQVTYMASGAVPRDTAHGGPISCMPHIA